MKKKMSTRKMVYLAMLAAVSAALMYLEIPLPFLPPFLKLDISGVPILIGSFMFGPVGGIFITGFLDLAVSFYLAFRLALTAQNVTGVDRRRLYAAMGRRALRQPLSFFFPVRTDGAAAPAPPDAAAHEARESG